MDPPTTLEKGKAASDTGFYVIQWSLKIFIASPFSQDLVRYLMLILWETMRYRGKNRGLMHLTSGVALTGYITLGKSLKLAEL